jgi:hypothetical protein
MPFLSSSEHPLERLAKMRVGFMFDSLQQDRVKQPLSWSNPNILQGAVPVNVWENATTRLLMNRLIIASSETAEQTLAEEFRQRFIVEVRSLLEYDDDFYAAPNFALRNTSQWNDPDRIVVALQNSTQDFALERLIAMIDELGKRILTDQLADEILGVARSKFLDGHRLLPLDPEQLRNLRRDVANHFLRLQDIHSDSFLEAVSIILDLGSYRAIKTDQQNFAFRNYHDLVILKRGTEKLADPELYDEAQYWFHQLKTAPKKGGLFGKSMETIEDLPKEHRALVIRGREITPSINLYGFP